MIVKIEITDAMRAYAHAASKEMGVLKNSISNGKGNVLGFLGEAMAASYLSLSLGENTYDYDMVLPDGRKIDVKTKKTTVAPKENYDCSISNFNTKQKCDIYVFCRVLEDQSRGWILGYDLKDNYMKTATFMKKGDIDQDNGYKVRADCYNKQIKDLSPVEELLVKRK